MNTKKKTFLIQSSSNLNYIKAEIELLDCKVFKTTKTANLTRILVKTKSSQTIIGLFGLNQISKDTDIKKLKRLGKYLYKKNLGKQMKFGVLSKIKKRISEKTTIRNRIKNQNNRNLKFLDEKQFLQKNPSR